MLMFQRTRQATCLNAALLLLWLLTACSRGTDAPVEPSPPQERAARLILHAKLYTGDAATTQFADGALAVGSDGRILDVGDSVVLQAAFPDAPAVDLAGRRVLPGLIDSHGHLYGLAESLTRADLVGSSSKEEVLARLRAFAAGLPAGEWVLGRGWDQNDWPVKEFPVSADLDAAFPDRPVWLERIDGHAGWGNSLALAQADRDLTGDWQPEGGAILRDESGQPTGVLVDHAMGLVEQAIPPSSPEMMEAALDRALELVASLGLTGVHDPGISRSVLETYHRRIEQGRFPLRLYAMADGVGPTLDWLCVEGAYDDGSGRLQMRAVKLYADGALGSRGAALLAPYADDPGNSGLLFAPDDQLQAQMAQAMSCGLQLAIHAIGDRANHQVLEAYAALQPGYSGNPGRHRIEHAQILDPTDIPRFAGLGVIAAMQPIHATSDMYWAGDRLGPGRLGGAYAWRSLLDSGAVLAFGSDFPVEQVNPMLGIYAAVTRQDLQGWPEGGWQPQERITLDQALRAFTLDAAYAAFMDYEVGSLEVGKRADFIVLDRDLFSIPAAEIPEVQVLQTWLDGQRVWSR